MLENINLPACNERSNEKKNEEVFQVVLDYGYIWFEILKANGHIYELKKNQKYLSVDNAARWFQSAVASGELRMGFIKSLKAKYDVDELAVFCTVEKDSEDHHKKSKIQLGQLFNEHESCLLEFMKLESLLRVCSETTRHLVKLDDIELFVQQVNRLKAARDGTYLHEMMNDKYWEPFSSLRAPSQAIYNLRNSLLFRNVARLCLRQSLAGIEISQTTDGKVIPKKSVVEVANTLSRKAVNMFVDACKPLFDKDAEISLESADELWDEIRDNEGTFENEIDFVERYSTRGPVTQEQRNNLRKYLQLPVLEIKVSESLAALKAVGIWQDENNEFIQTLNAFQLLVNDKSSSIAKVAEAMEGDVKRLDKLLDEVETMNVISEIGKARDLLEFSRGKAKEDMTVLIDAVEEHFEQLVNVTEAIVSDLIEVHRFLRTIFKAEKIDPLDFLEMVKVGLQNSKGMAVKINVCRCNIHSLNNLYMNLANRGEMTKETIANILKSGSYNLSIEPSGEWNVTLSYLSESGNVVKLPEAELQDLRSRALLISGSDKKRVPAAKEHCKPIEAETTLVEFGQFIEQVDLVFEIVNTCLELQRSGNPKYKTFWAEGLSAVKLRSIESKVKEVKEDSTTWEATLASARKKHPFLNFFWSDQLWTLYDFFTGRDGNGRNPVNEAACTLLRFIDPSISLHELDHFQNLYKASQTSLEGQLCSIGTVLDLAFKTRRKAHGVVLDTFPARVTSEAAKPMRFQVALLDSNSTQTVHAAMSLFKEFNGRIPEPSHLLFCQEDTSWDEVSLFLRRCVNKPTEELADILHCIANVERLENEVQFKLVSEIKSYQRESELLSNLALVCRGEKNSYFASQFSEFVIENIARMSSNELTKWLTNCQENSLDVHFVTSHLAGLGKTEFIHKEAARRKCRVVTFPISGHVSRRNILERLSNLKIHPDFECLHLDIGEVDDPLLLDTFLFQYIVLGMVSFGTQLCHRQPTNVYIEIANTPRQWLRDSFPVCSCFRKCDDHLSSTSVLDRLVVSNEITSPIQVVCHYLDTLDRECLDETDLHFSGNCKLEPLSRERCVVLLKKHLENKVQLSTEVLSFNILNTFLNVLAAQLLKVSSSPYFRIENLKQMIEAPSGLREQLVHSLFDVSLDFASRQVDTYSSKTQSSSVSDISVEDVEMFGETSEDVLTRFGGMKLWKENNHLVLMFHSQGHSVSVLYRKVKDVPDTVKELVNRQKGTLHDYTTVSQEVLQTTLDSIAGNQSSTNLTTEQEPYALTADNILKMALILMRIRARIPVIIMGDTGCGKTALVRYLANVSGTNFHVYSLHAGITEDQLINFVQEMASLAESCNERGNPVWVFLDEINACDHLGTINEIICHHELQGKLLPSNLVFIAACNPYRLRPEQQQKTAGLSKEKSVDDLSKLVYRVHPLPETMLDHVWDYGSLSPEDEHSYIERMVEGLFEDRHSKLLPKLLCQSQEFIRNSEKTPFCVSLRDINRCKHLMQWFNETLQKRPPLQRVKIEQHLESYFEAVKDIDIELRSVVLALAHCYQSRLPSADLREEYRQKMSQLFCLEGHQLSGTHLQQIVRVEEEEYLARMELPPGTAKNEALRENVFIILVSLLNYLPVFVVGKPGCSKSLSVQIIRSNLRGRDSTDEFFKQLPQLLIVSHQGSESSTSEGIQKVFEKAQKYKTNNKDASVLPVVLLDEVGLAEHSPFNPLKVLHSLLEPADGRPPDIGVVGISNWALDPAKMNRAIHLSRPEPDINDLYETGRSIRHASLTKTTRAGKPSGNLFPSDEHLKCLATAYHKYQRNQKHANCFGLRDYYSLVKCLSSSQETRGQELERMDENLFQRAFQRNFGGLPDNVKSIQTIFFEQLSGCSIYEIPASVPVTDLITENLCDENARHLMVITSGDAATDILTTTLQSLDKEVVSIFGSRLEEDRCEDYNYRVLSRVILYMERDCVLILRDLDDIYGSLYDMLNQNYAVVGGKKNCRVALGPYSNPMCQVHSRFRCIVLIEESKVPFTDPPFLNRFEKQLLRFEDVLDEQEKSVVTNLRQWARSISTGPNLDMQFVEKDMFVGFQADTLPSLVLSKTKHPFLSEGDLLKKCKEDLMSIASADGALRSWKSQLADKCPDEVEDHVECFLKQPVHLGLSHFLQSTLEVPDQQTAPESLKSGLMLLVLTHSSIHTDISKHLPFVTLWEQQQAKESRSNPSCQVERLSAFKSEKNLTKQIRKFWMESDASLLVLQCRLGIDGPNMLLAKSIMEHQRQEFLTSANMQGPKHVCIVMHVVRCCVEPEKRHSLPFNFLSGWKTVMIDNLEPPVIPLPSLAKLEVHDLFQSYQNLTQAIVCNELQWCLMTGIKYTASQREPHEILDLAETASKKPKVMEAILRVVLKLIQNHNENFEINPDDVCVIASWLLQIASDPQTLVSSVTLYDAIKRFLEDTIRIPLAKLVYFLEQESAWNVLTTCKEDEETIEVWTKLLQDEEIVNLDDVPDSRGVESYSLYQPIAPLKFPFSSVFAKQIDSLRGIFMENLSRMEALSQDDETDQDLEPCDYTNEMDGRLVKRLFYRFTQKVAKKVPHFANEHWLTENIFLYVEDLCDLKSADFAKWVTRERRVTLLKASCAEIMKSCGPTIDVHLFLLQLHACFWFQRNLLSDVMQLASACSDVCELGELLEEHSSLLQELFSTKKEASSSSSERIENSSLEKEEVQDKSMTNPDKSNVMKQNNSSNEVGFVGLTSGDQLEQDTIMSLSTEGSACLLDNLSEPVFEEALVEQICKTMFLSANHIDHSDGITVDEWYRRVSLVLTSAVNIFDSRVPPMVFHVLRVCSDFARLVVLNDFADVRDLCILAETGMSENGSFFENQREFQSVCQRVDKLASSANQELEHLLHEFLSLFFNRCIDAWATLELDHFAEVLDAMAERMLRQENPSITFAAPVLMRLIHQEIPKDVFEEVIRSSDKVNDNPFLACIDKYLSQKEEDDSRPDSLPAVVCSDVIECIAFKKYSLLPENEPPHMSLQNLQASFNVLTQDDVSNKGIRLVCAVAYIRSFMKSTAEVIRQDTVVSEEMSLALKELNLIFSQSSDCELFMARRTAILLSLLRHLRMDSPMYEVKTLCETNCIIPGLRNNVQWVEEKSSKVYFDPFIKLKANSEIFSAVANSVRYGINEDKLKNVLAEASEGRLQRLQTFAALEELLFRVRAERTMKDTEINIGQFLARGLQEFQSPYAQLIRCTVGDVDFNSPELQLTPESNSSDANIALLLLHFAAIITSALDNDVDASRRPFFSMINPEMIETSFVLAMPNFDCGQTDQRQDVVPNDTKHYLCSCGTVFVTTRGDICPSCRRKCEPVPDVKKIDVKMSLKGYVQLNCEDTENEEFRVRSLSPAVFRILHLFVHAALYMGPTLGIVSEECLRGVLKQTKSSQYCFGQVVNDLNVLTSILHSREEHVIALLHVVLTKTKQLVTSDTQQGCCTTAEERQQWEMEFTKIVNPVLKDFPQVLRKDVMTRMRPNVSSTEISIEERIDEQDESSMAETQKARLFVPRFFRSVKPRSFEELKMRLVYSEEIKKYPFLQLFFQYDSILPILQHTHSFLKWSQTVNTHLGHRLRRCDSRKMVSSFISGKGKQQLSSPTKRKDLSLKEAFETFVESWEKVRPLVVKEMGKGKDYVPRITEMSEMSHCLLESTGDGIFLATALKVLARYQNEFLVKALSLSTNISCRALTFLSKGTCVSAAPIIHLQDANEKQIIQFHWPEDTEDVLRHSHNNPEYGRGYDVHYDFDKIEMELACLLLVGKAYLSTTGGLREFVFAQELFHSYSNILEDLHQVIPQEPLTQGVREGLQRLEDEDKSKVQDLFSYLESLLCFLKRTNEEGEKSLIQYTKEWLSKLPVPFPLELLPEPRADIKLKHVAALYENVEDILAQTATTRLKEIYRKPLPRGAKEQLYKVLKRKMLNSVETVEAALRRFAYRYLCSGKTAPSPGEPLSQYLLCQSLWPIAMFKEEVAVKESVEHMVRPIFPDEIKVEHTVEAAKALQELTKVRCYLHVFLVGC